MDEAPTGLLARIEIPAGDPDPSRIAAMLGAIAQISEGGTSGITRLGFTQLERDAHALFAKWLTDLGLRTSQDAIGNTIAEMAGTQRLPAIGICSHLDSVPNGGRYDGIVGIVGAVELIRTLQERRVSLSHPLRIVAFSCEEGARFGQACIGSHAVAGSLDAARLDRLHDASGVTLSAAMASVGLDPGKLPSARWPASEWAAFLELHIEQGRVLEAHGIPIGIVDSVSGSTRLLIEITGRADHSGGTPMDDRADALAGAAELVLVAESIARDPYHRGMRITVGRLSVMPNSVTTIAGRAVLSVDIRDVDADRQRRTANEFRQVAERLAERRGVDVSFEVIGDTSPVVLPRWLRDHVIETCRAADIPYRVMVSGASHDSQVVNQVVPAAIIFLPSRGGLSHVPDEWTSTIDIARGVHVMRESVMRLDAVLEHDPGPISGVVAAVPQSALCWRDVDWQARGISVHYTLVRMERSLLPVVGRAKNRQGPALNRGDGAQARRRCLPDGEFALSSAIASQCSSGQRQQAVVSRSVNASAANSAAGSPPIVDRLAIQPLELGPLLGLGSAAISRLRRPDRGRPPQPETPNRSGRSRRR